MRKVFVLVLVSLIVLLTMPLIFTNVVSAGDAVEIGGKIYYLEKGDLLFYESSFMGKKLITLECTAATGSLLMLTQIILLMERKIKSRKIRQSKPVVLINLPLNVTASKLHKKKRNAAVNWTEGKHGKDFDILPSAPCDAGDEWYCSELVYCAYKAQGITFGDESGRIWPSEIISDSDVESTSPECPAGSPNAGTYYAPGTTEDGCCNWSGPCFDGDQPSNKCSACYEGQWHSGWWCEEGECVPEASTLVLFAVGLVSLAGYIGLRRKEN